MKHLRIALLAAVSLTSCSQAAMYSVKGNVVDGDGAYLPVTNAAISVNGKALATTDSKGDFVISLESIPPTLSVRVTAENYAPKNVVMSGLVARANGVKVMLRTYDTVTSVTLPTNPNDPVPSVSIPRSNSTATVRLPYNSMVFASNGQPATGKVDVAMTFWPTTEPLFTAPAPLYGVMMDNPNALTPLTTYGMADIEVRQNGELLQVAPGAALPFTVSVPQSTLQKFSQKNSQLTQQGNVPMPSLFYADPNSGLWIEQINPASGAIAFDPNAGTFTGNLPHLTAWNWDFGGFNTATKGGCITGHVMTTVGDAPYTGMIALTFMSFENTEVIATSTDVNGNFCLNVGMNADTPQLLNYYISAANDYTNSSQPNPLNNPPQLYPNPIPDMQYWWGTQTEAVDTPTWNTAPFGGDWGLSLGGGSNQASFITWGTCAQTCAFGASTVPCVQCSVQTASGVVSIPYVQIQEAQARCGNGGACSQVPDTYINNGSGPSACGYTGCVHKAEGDACDPSGKANCCFPSSTLVCADAVCVPK